MENSKKFNTAEENLYDCPERCANKDIHCMVCNLGSHFKKV